MKSTLPLPFTSAYDPPMSGEGRLDPLGLGTIADRIADSYAKPVRARMRRVRFLTSMALGAKVSADLVDVMPGVGGDTPEIAFERMVIECLARASTEGMALDTGIPGITKAQAALMSKGRLDARGYLKSPRVFGFFGVYRPLATGVGLLDAQDRPLEPGNDLLLALQQDKRDAGTSQSDPLSPEFLSWLSSSVASGLETGRNTFGVKSPHTRVLAGIAAPQHAGAREKEAIKTLLSSPEPMALPEDEAAYLEVLGLLDRAPTELATDIACVAYLKSEGSSVLQARMDMLLNFEEFARDVLWAFDRYRFLSTHAVGRVPDRSIVTNDDELASVATRIKDRYEAAADAMQRAVDLGADPELPLRFEQSFRSFAQPVSPDSLIELLMVRHGEVQAAKPPNGKRPWLENVNGAWVCRPLFAVQDPVERAEDFIHPYRLTSITRFLADLHG